MCIRDSFSTSNLPHTTTALPLVSPYPVCPLTQVTPDDQGMYRCLAANAVGEAEQSVRVMVERAPRPTTLPSQPRPAEEQASPSDGPCATNPCYNGGTCSPDEREPRRARCQCQSDYHGRKCQFKRRPPPVEAVSYTHLTLPTMRRV